ncbi:DUF6326 family protein [Maribacter chungangensis]|uniref:DUF6326 family protein n=1 Tax=Maribacter chungangensis TaxID=1069117 RepID=A0ABW3B248_9FLAO
MTNLKTRELLSTLWIVLTVNYIFCDVFSLYLSETLEKLMAGGMGGIKFTQEFLLVFSIIMEMPMLMIILSKVLDRKINKWLNLIVGLLLLIVQVGSILTDENYLHYLFFSVVEISILLIILVISFKWKGTVIPSDRN